MKKIATFSLITLCFLSCYASADSASDAKCRYENANGSLSLYKGNSNTILYGNEFTTDWKSWDEAIPLFKSISDILNRRGIQLLVVPVPTRPMVNPEILRNDIPLEQSFLQEDPSRRFTTLLGNFKKSGVSVVNLLQSFRSKTTTEKANPNYFQEEFHWTQLGASVAAQSIAKSIKGIQQNSGENSILANAGISQFEPVSSLRDLNKLCGLNNSSLPYQKIQYFKPWEAVYENFASQEFGNGNSWRWSLGPRGTIFFSAPDQKKLHLKLKIDSPLKNQSMKISFNSKAVYTYDARENDKPNDIDLEVTSSKGINNFVFEFSNWNHKSDTDTFAPADAKNLAVKFESVLLIDGKGKPLAQAGQDMAAALFDNNIPQVTLIGTSYSSYMNLANLLEGTLNTDVLDESVAAGGFFKSMQAYLNSTDLKLDKPKAIVWELPMMWPTLGFKAGLQGIVDTLNK